MHIARIQNFTRVLGAPSDWQKEEKGACLGLPIADVLLESGRAMQSAWYPTPAEIASIVKGGAVILTVLGTIHPPVALDVGLPPEEEV